jgi:hypothetical protein
MFHLISNVENAINLQQYIDNTDGCKRVGLKSFRYTLGWYNIIEEFIKISEEKPYKIPPGYYSFKQLVDVFQKSYNISLRVDETNGKVILNTPHKLKLTNRLSNMLGFEKVHFEPNIDIEGEKTLDMKVIKSLYIHLKQLNSFYNFFDGSPSMVLAVIPIKNKQFGDIIPIRFNCPEYKHLAHGTISELELEVKDVNNKTIDNHGLLINAVLEIK